jgi:hypothetical protein
MFVIFNKETTVYLRIFRNRYWQNADHFKTEAAAKACLTRAAKKGTKVEDYAILPYDEFKKIEKTEVKHNLLGGGTFTQSVNTPACCDPSTETYHSM